MEGEDDSPSDTFITTMIPQDLLLQVLEFLSFSERRNYFLCSSELWASCSSLEALYKRLVLPQPPPSTLLSTNFVNFHSLTLTSCATDDFLRSLEGPECLPLLIHLNLSKSLRITNVGLEALTHNPMRCSTLETIDITYCRNTTYAGTFILRDTIKSLKHIRRQPAWMDGHYQTPFENDGIHTFYADGTFQFERESPSSGYVCDLFEWQDDNPFHIATKLQYNDIGNALEVLVWPQEYRNVYRPGVSLLKVPHQQAVLVAQHAKGLYPPKEYPTLAHSSVVPLGKSRHFDIHGNALPESNHDSLHFMISYIAMQPLEHLMPPSAVVEKNRELVSSLPLNLHSGKLSRQEMHLHAMLYGHQQDLQDILEAQPDEV